MYNSLFNTPDGQEFEGIQADAEFGKAKKGSPEYDEWLRKYREKRGRKSDDDTLSKKKAAKETLSRSESNPDDTYYCRGKEIDSKFKVTKEQVVDKLKESGINVNADDLLFDNSGKTLSVSIKGTKHTIDVATTQSGLIDPKREYNFENTKRDANIAVNNSLSHLRKVLGQPNAYDIKIDSNYSYRNGKRVEYVSAIVVSRNGSERKFEVEVDESGKVLGESEEGRSYREALSQERREQEERKQQAGGGFYVGGKKSTEAQYNMAKDQIAAMANLGVDASLLSQAMGLDNRTGDGYFKRTTAGYTNIGGDLGFAINEVSSSGKWSWEPVTRDGKIRVRNGLEKPMWVTPEFFNSMLAAAVKED